MLLSRNTLKRRWGGESSSINCSMRSRAAVSVEVMVRRPSGFTVMVTGAGVPGGFAEDADDSAGAGAFDVWFDSVLSVFALVFASSTKWTVTRLRGTNDAERS